MNIYIETDGGEVGLDNKNLTSVWCKHQVMHILFLASGSGHVIVIVLIAVITGLDLAFRGRMISQLCAKRIGTRADVRSVESKEACFNICQENRQKFINLKLQTKDRDSAEDASTKRKVRLHMLL